MSQTLDKLVKYQQMLDKGLITMDDFELVKHHLLGDHTAPAPNTGTSASPAAGSQPAHGSTRKARHQTEAIPTEVIAAAQGSQTARGNTRKSRYQTQAIPTEAIAAAQDAQPTRGNTRKARNESQYVTTETTAVQNNQPSRRNTRKTRNQAAQDAPMEATNAIAQASQPTRTNSSRRARSQTQAAPAEAAVAAQEAQASANRRYHKESQSYHKASYQERAESAEKSTGGFLFKGSKPVSLIIFTILGMLCTAAAAYVRLYMYPDGAPTIYLVLMILLILTIVAALVDRSFACFFCAAAIVVEFLYYIFGGGMDVPDPLFRITLFGTAAVAALVFFNIAAAIERKYNQRSSLQEI